MACLVVGCVQHVQNHLKLGLGSGRLRQGSGWKVYPTVINLAGAPLATSSSPILFSSWLQMEDRCASRRHPRSERMHRNDNVCTNGDVVGLHRFKPANHSRALNMWPGIRPTLTALITNGLHHCQHFVYLGLFRGIAGIQEAGCQARKGDQKELLTISCSIR